MMDYNFQNRFRFSVSRDYKEYNEELNQPDFNVDIEFHAETMDEIIENLVRFFKASGYDWVDDLEIIKREYDE